MDKKEKIVIVLIIAVLAACAIYIVPKAVKAYRELDKKMVDTTPKKASAYVTEHTISEDKNEERIP